jgi:hypothetical protein
VQSVVDSVQRTRQAAESGRKHVLTLQSRLAEQEARVRIALSSIEQAENWALQKGEASVELSPSPATKPPFEQLSSSNDLLSAGHLIEFIRNAGTFAVVSYFLFVLSLYGIAPARFVAWHEWIATEGIPFGEKLAKTLAPFLLGTPHALNAVVRRYQERARRLFDDTQEAKERPAWVPAPLTIGNELIHVYSRPPDLPAEKFYVAGLQELKARPRMNHMRWIISIEGPGGVGKSALAFQIARWASDSRSEHRLARFPILPWVLRRFPVCCCKRFCAANAFW